MKCRVCRNKIIKFLSLGKLPLANAFLKKSQIRNEKTYELSLGFCTNCYLVQLTKTIDPKKLFSKYIYFSSTSSSFLNHCEEIALYLTQRLSLKKDSLVLEIASNDGAQLQYFKKLGIKTLGIDPAKNIARSANKRGIKTIAAFFNNNYSKKLKKRKVNPDLIFGANVLAHVPEIVDFVMGIKEILKPEGTAVFEFPYIKGLFENKFDTIYHEHVFYYSLIALENLFKTVDLQIYDVELTKSQGGSLMIFICHKGRFKINKRVSKLRNIEIASGYKRVRIYFRIAVNIQNLKKDLLGLINRIKNKGGIIAAYGASAKGNILLNFFEIDYNFLDFIVDKSKSKQGLYAPGSHMLVYPVEKIYMSRMPDYLLILVWNITGEIVTQMRRYRKSGGKFIIPIPKVKII